MAKTDFSESRLHTSELFREEKIKKDYSLYFRFALTFSASFLFSCFNAFDGISPFGVCFCAAISYELCFAAFSGSLIGYVLTLSAGNILRYAAALALCCAVRYLTQKHFPSKIKPSLLSLISSLPLLLSGAFYLLLNKAELLSFAVLFAEALLSLVFTPILAKALSSPFFFSKSCSVSVKDSLCITVCSCVLMLCGCGLTVNGFSPVRIPAFICVMVFALLKGAPYGSACGISVGATLSFLPGFSNLFPALALGGFMAGAFSSYGQTVCSGVFFLFFNLASFLRSADTQFFVLLAESFAACLIFILVPASFTEKAEKAIKKLSIIKSEKQDSSTSRQLRTAANNIRQVCDIISRVSDRLEKQNEESESFDPLFGMKLFETRRLLTDQFSTTGDFLSTLADRIADSRIQDPSRSVSLKSALKEVGIYVDSLNYYTDAKGAATVEIILIDRPLDINWKKTGTIISLMTSRTFEVPEVRVNNLTTTLTYTQKLPYRLQIGYCQKPASDGAVCGDSVAITAKIDSRGFAVISDGMGTGPRAAIDSNMTSSVMKKLVCSGFTFESAAKIVNSALIVRGQEESIASIDAVETNLFTGETVFYKAGATYSLIRKKDRTAALEKASLPLGILRNVSLSKSRFTAEAGDIILLFSDGVTQGDWSWINDELLSWSTNNMEELSTHILKLASLKREKATADDMTVVAIKLEKNR